MIGLVWALSLSAAAHSVPAMPEVKARIVVDMMGAAKERIFRPLNQS